LGEDKEKDIEGEEKEKKAREKFRAQLPK